jgi:phosphoserine phosphatase
VLAIGDGANDAVMLIQTGLSIAYNAKKNWIGWPMLRCQRRISSIFFICRELLKKISKKQCPARLPEELRL